MRTVISLFTGCMGLDLGLERAGWTIRAAVENDIACQKLIRARRPDLTLFSDVRDIASGRIVFGLRPTLLAGGFPCQDLSNAGKGAGLAGEQSGLWHFMADTVRLLRPDHVLVENVPGIFAKMGARPGESAFGTVIGDLAEAGYVGRWIRLRAADIGAPHGRDRVFVLASLPDSDRIGVTGRGAAGDVAGPTRDAEEEGLQRQRSRDAADDRRPAPADPGGDGQLRQPAGDRQDGGLGVERGDDAHRRDLAGAGPRDGHSGQAAADADRAGRKEHGGAVPVREELGSVERGGGQTLPDPAELGFSPGAGLRQGDQGRIGRRRPDNGDAPDDGGQIDWGAYRPAVRRWEHILGRAAPVPTDARGRLEARFVEWMLGFPDNWTDVEGLTRTTRLKMLGNAVQVQCGEVVGRMIG